MPKKTWSVPIYALIQNFFIIIPSIRCNRSRSICSVLQISKVLRCFYLSPFMEFYSYSGCLIKFFTDFSIGSEPFDSQFKTWSRYSTDLILAQKNVVCPHLCSVFNVVCPHLCLIYIAPSIVHIRVRILFCSLFVQIPYTLYSFPKSYLPSQEHPNASYSKTILSFLSPISPFSILVG